MNHQPLLSIRHLTTLFDLPGRTVHAVDDVSFEISRGEIFGLVGESGCGKSATCRSILRLFAGAPARIVQGSVLLNGRDLLQLDENQMSDVRGAEIAMIFQDPMTSLNPTMRVGEQIAEGLLRHQRLSRAQSWRAARDSLGEVGVSRPETRMADYPHQFSGGMRQRVMIAIALACRPQLLIADEPTTALDVTIQDQILKLLLRIRDEYGMAILLVTHDLGVVAQTCERVAVMYTGRIAELADARSLLKYPRHPYSRALLNSIPGQDEAAAELVPIPGSPPDLSAPLTGCRFHPRCSYASAECKSAPPDLIRVRPGQETSCIRHWILS